MLPSQLIVFKQSSLSPVISHHCITLLFLVSYVALNRPDLWYNANQLHETKFLPPATSHEVNYLMRYFEGHKQGDCFTRLILSIKIPSAKKCGLDTDKYAVIAAFEADYRQLPPEKDLCELP